MKSLGNFLLEKREEHKDEMKKELKTKYIGEQGEIFAYNYLENLLKRKNGIRNCNIVPHGYDYEDFDLEIYFTDRNYKIEVKFSTSKHPQFSEIHFKNDFDFLLLIWKRKDEEIYFSILTKEEAKEIATPMNTNREDEDNWKIKTTGIFEETNEKFLNKLAMLLELDKELEDLEENEKLSLIENAKELVIKENPNAQINDFDGETYQEWFYDYLSNYTDDVELKPYGDEYDISYKRKKIEIKYSTFYRRGFKFESIKPNLFDFIFLIGFDEKENKFYFSIKTRDEIVEIKKELAGTDKFFSQNGFTLNVGKHNSKLNFVNDFTFEDFDNLITNNI